jgi:5-oxopent-3-ene-1,2,5-tricarboxylate decarboxylase / 2-hydroxyhepta-2,4-diene-1,7-dioate isomerase
MIHRTFAFRRTTLAAGVALAVLVFSGIGGLAQQAEPPIFRLLTFEVGASGPRLGATEGNGEAEIVDVHNAIRYLLATDAPEGQSLPAIPIDMRSLIEAGDRPIAAVRSLYATITALKAKGTFTEPGGMHRVFHPPSGVHFLPPIPNPSKILGLAGNYVRPAPAEGTDYGRYDDVEYPSAFFKSVAALVGHGDEINMAGLLTKGVHEPELAFVIGKTARNVPESEAMDYVVGYMILDEVSARDLIQGKHNSQGSTIGKGLDTFAPAGPYLTLKADVPDPHNLAIEAKLNGEVWEIPNANTSFLTFTIPQQIAYFTERMTLLPGDIVATGVPAPVVPLRVGDTVEITLDRLGTLRNTVVSKPAPGPRFPPRKAPASR